MTVSRQTQSPAARTGLRIHVGGYQMVPQLIARVDGLPVSLLDREVVWPTPSSPARSSGELTARQRARIERQTRRRARVPAAGVGAGADRRAAGRVGAARDPLGARAGGAALMRGHRNPLGWAATLLIAVAYAHVLLELAAAVLAIAVAVRLLTAPACELLSARARRSGLPGRRRCDAVVIDRRPAMTARGRDHAS